MRFINNDYLVECCFDLSEELKGNENNEQIVNWFNFNLGSRFYDDNSNKYIIEEIDHDSKYVKLS